MRGRTTIFISHRISTARHADRSPSWSTAASPNSAPTKNCSPRNGYYASLFQKQLLEEELAVVG